jgi:two-component system, NtrC family, nitrogen regulation sensor histidine kinase NtrY
MSPTKRRTQLWLVFGGLLIALLLAGVVTVGSLDLPFQSGKWSDVLILFAVTTFIVAALLIFGLVMSRSLVRLWAERRADRLGTRFKTKMVGAAMGISLLPVVTLFFISYGLLNHTLARWFPRPLEMAVDESQKLLADFGRSQLERMNQLAAQSRNGLPGDKPGEMIHAALLYGADAAWIQDSRGNASETQISVRSAETKPDEFQLVEHPASSRLVRMMPSGAELWQSGDMSFVVGRAALGERSLVVARRVPEDMLQRFNTVESQMQAYGAQKQQYRAYKTSILLVLSLFTLLLLFTSTWFALFLSKQVTVPIQALAEATLEVTAGHFDHRVEVQAQDELGLLVRSFNLMTAQLGESHRQIAEFTRSLQQAVQEMERRRKLMEAILENIPTAVISLDDAGNILRTNPAVLAIFGETSRSARTLGELVGEEAARGLQHLMRRSLRMGTASRELEISVGGRLLHAAVTVSSLGPRRSNPGFVVVVDDLTDLLRAQKAAAWQEVAQRIAHEIKNPLTPIQLSAQRLSRFLERRAEAARPENAELVRLVGECSGMIEREVAALKSLVDEFSQFARFPSARLQATDVNAVVSSALGVFHGRLEGVSVRTRLAAALPAVKADPELLQRVIVNLIDNAAEAMENGIMRELEISTRAHPDSEMVEIVVADSGHGISPEDKDRLFLPHFSTKDRGTGLGLAIANRIIAEHNGMLRVEDNNPSGARFVISLPVAELIPTPVHADS